MWALGIILHELATKTLPFNNESEILSPQKVDVPSTVPPLIRSLICILLDKNPETRPDAEQLLNQPELLEAVKDLGNKIKEVDPEMAQKIMEPPKKFK